jgi:ribosomal protein S13
VLIYLETKEIAYALTYIHGIGLTSAKKMVEFQILVLKKELSDLTTEETSGITSNFRRK